jgi:hypothetical protein
MATSKPTSLNRSRTRDRIVPWLRQKLRQFARLTGILPPSVTLEAVSPKQFAVSDLAARLTQVGNAAVTSEDDPASGLGFAAAICLYRDALNCIAPPRSTDCAQPDEFAAYLQGLLTAPSLRQLPPQVIQAALDATPVDLAMLPAENRRAQALALRQLCEFALRHQIRDLESRTLKRLGRVARAVISTFLAVGLVSLAAYGVSAHTNLARKRPWRLSSSMGPCKPVDEGGCGAARPGIFFHTKEEESPWIEYDLGKATAFTSVLVENARDGLQERAVPLAVEISNDQVHWREVARATSSFAEWSTSFPKVTARYVRFRVLHLTYLHLARVEIRR